MKKVFLVARHHFAQEVSKRSFLIILFSMPLFLVVVIGFGYLAAQLEDDSITLGYVDEAGFLKQLAAVDNDDEVNMISFDTRSEALESLDSSQVDAVYILPTSFGTTSEAELIFVERPPGKAMRYFEDNVRLNLLAGQPQQSIDRMLSGSNVTVVATELNRQYNDGAPTAGQVIPILVAVMFAFLVLTTAGYMTQVIVVEKENRTMEVVLMAISSNKLMVGKVIGILGVAALQLVIWLAFFVIAIWVGVNVFEIEWLRVIDVSWRDMLLIMLVAFPTYLFIAAMMTAIGASLTSGQEAEQVGPLLFLILLLPIYFSWFIANDPNGPVALALGFIPGTSVVALSVRSLFLEVPLLQFVLATLIASIAAVLAIWLTGRALRLSMLRYGQNLSIYELLGWTGFSSKSS